MFELDLWKLGSPSRLCGSRASELIESEVTAEKLNELRALHSFHPKNKMHATILSRLAVTNNSTTVVSGYRNVWVVWRLKPAGVLRTQHQP